MSCSLTPFRLCTPLFRASSPAGSTTPASCGGSVSRARRSFTSGNGVGARLRVAPALHERGVSAPLLPPRPAWGHVAQPHRVHRARHLHVERWARERPHRCVPRGAGAGRGGTHHLRSGFGARHRDRSGALRRRAHRRLHRSPIAGSWNASARTARRRSVSSTTLGAATSRGPATTERSRSPTPPPLFPASATRSFRAQCRGCSSGK